MCDSFQKFRTRKQTQIEWLRCYFFPSIAIKIQKGLTRLARHSLVVSFNNLQLSKHHPVKAYSERKNKKASYSLC
jgi:hypothetical protein